MTHLENPQLTGFLQVSGIHWGRDQEAVGVASSA